MNKTLFKIYWNLIKFLIYIGIVLKKPLVLFYFIFHILKFQIIIIIIIIIFI